MDFGMRSLGQSVAQSSDKSVAWSDVEVVGEVTNQARLDNEKILQFCDYARFAFINQVDRVFLYGLLIHKEDCYVVLFTSTSIIMARSIKLSNALHVTRLVAALHCVGNVGRGRDLKFGRSWSSVCHDKYGEEECSKLSTPCNTTSAMSTLSWSFTSLATCTDRFLFLAVGRMSFYAGFLGTLPLQTPSLLTHKV